MRMVYREVRDIGGLNPEPSGWEWNPLTTLTNTLPSPHVTDVLREVQLL